MHYDLLALAWWQNPWILATGVLSILALLLIGYLLWRWFSQGPFVRALKKLRRAPLTTLADQIIFCSTLTGLMKRLHAGHDMLATMVQSSASDALTDQELVGVMRDVCLRGNDPVGFVEELEVFRANMTLVKFAGVMVEPEILHRCLTLCERYQVYLRQRVG